MTNQSELSAEQSLRIIQQMITEAKANFTNNGRSWLLWGTMLFLTSVCTYIFIDIGADNIFLAWNIFGAVSIILLLVALLKPRSKPVRTYMDDLLRLVDIGFIASLAIIIFSINISVSPNSGFGFFLMIFGFLMLIKGGAIRSRSLIVGAIVNWAGAIAIIINDIFKYDMLIMAAAVLVGYIIPGLLLTSAYRRNKLSEKRNQML